MPSTSKWSRDDFQVPPKHSIFLCHAGAQKAFVEQLYVDLKRRGLSPFFDQCPDSLPKGEVFPERIFKAAKECLVAVVVLSSEFLVSLWPMLELAAFVQAQRTCNPNLKIFPLFYKLEVADLKKDSKAITLRMAKWKEMAAVEERIDIDAWQNSVAALSRANGEVFSSYAGSEVKYREAIVDSICKLVGKDRLCNWKRLLMGLWFLVGSLRRFCNFCLQHKVILHLHNSYEDGFAAERNSSVAAAPSAPSVELLYKQVFEFPYPKVSTALPPLPDGLVAEQILPRLLALDDPFLILRLRSLSKGWRSLVESSEKWPILNSVPLDSPGYLTSARLNGFQPINVIKRYRHEVKHFRSVPAKPSEPITVPVSTHTASNSQSPKKRLYSSGRWVEHGIWNDYHWHDTHSDVSGAYRVSTHTASNSQSLKKRLYSSGRWVEHGIWNDYHWHDTHADVSGAYRAYTDRALRQFDRRFNQQSSTNRYDERD